MSEQLHTRASWWALIVLTATYTFSFIDRQIINLLVDPIRTDLSLSDSQVSFLQGLAFVLPYVILSIPLGRIVDRARVHLEQQPPFREARHGHRGLPAALEAQTAKLDASDGAGGRRGGGCSGEEARGQLSRVDGAVKR